MDTKDLYIRVLPVPVFKCAGDCACAAVKGMVSSMGDNIKSSFGDGICQCLWASERRITGISFIYKDGFLIDDGNRRPGYLFLCV